MLSLISERSFGYSQLLHLTHDESKALDKAILQVAPFKLQHKVGDAYENTAEFLSIHKKIKDLKQNEKLSTEESELLDLAEASATIFEKTLLHTVSTGNAPDLDKIKVIETFLNKFKNDPLLKNIISPELKELAEQIHTFTASYEEFVSLKNALESNEQLAGNAMLQMTIQQEALEQGETDFSLNSDLNVLEAFDQFVQLYKKYENEESMPFYYGELLSQLTQETAAIRFNREEFRAEFQSAIEAEVMKTLLAIQNEPEDEETESRHTELLNELAKAAAHMEAAKNQIDSHIETLNDPKPLAEKLFQEITSIHNQLDNDIKFLKKQIQILTKRESVGLWGRWTIYSRGKQVERNVQLIKEVEEDKPVSLGRKILHMGVWGLYLSPHISSLAQFASQTYEAITTGESPLKKQADLMSDLAFAKKANELPPEEQEKADFEVNTVQGILSGYIPLNEAVAKEHPEAGDYVTAIRQTAESNQNETPNYQNGRELTLKGDFDISVPVLSTGESEVYAMRFLGEKVRQNYSETGKQLEWENPLGNLSGESQFFNFVPPEDKPPQSIYTILGQECVASIREAKRGIPLEENKGFQNLQNRLQDVFGSKLPVDWFDGWILKQEWSDARLSNFQTWFSHNLECQVRQFINNQDIHQRKPEGVSSSINLLTSGTRESRPLVERSGFSFTLTPREFELFENLAAEVNATVQTTQETPKSHTSKSYAQALNVYRYVADKEDWIWGSPKVADHLLLHQLGDFFGTATGLEGFDQIKAFEFHRDIIKSLMKVEGESQHLQMLQFKLEQAISLSRLLVHGDLDSFREALETGLQMLGPNDSVFLEGGWIGKKTGHSVIYEIIKEEKGKFSFRAYNTGSGTEYHTIEAKDLKHKVVPFVEISSIPIDQILDRPFLLVWQKMLSKVPEEEPWGPKDVYTSLLSHLEGESRTVRYSEEDLMTPQRSGTCSFMSLHALFYHLNEDKSISQKDRFKMLTAGISNYVVWNKERLSTSPAAQNLFSKSLEEYGRIVSDMHDKKIIDDFEMTEAGMRVKEFQKVLETGKLHYRESLESRAHNIYIDEVAIFNDEALSLPEQAVLDPLKSVSAEPRPVFQLDELKTWKPSQENLVKDLSSFIKSLQTGTSEKSHLSVLLEIQNLVQKLDLTSMEFDKKDSEQVIDKLHTLGLLYYENIQRSCSQRPDSHCQMLSPKMLLTLNRLLFQATFLLERHYPEGSKLLASSPFAFVNKRMLNSKLIRFMDPVLDEQFENMVLSIKRRNLFSPFKILERSPDIYNKEKFGLVGSDYYLYALNKYRINTEPDIPVEEEYIDRFLFADTTIYEGKTYKRQREFYPKEFYQLYDLGALSLGLERLPISLTSIQEDTPISIERKVELNKYYNTLEADDNAIFHPIGKLDNEYPVEVDYLNLAGYHLEQVIPKIEDPLLLNILNFKENKDFRFFQRENTFQVESPPTGITFQRYKELNALTSSRDLVVKETLSYFSANANLLVKPEYQTFFINLMFTPGILINELNRSGSELTAKSLGDFTIRNFAFYKNTGDLKTATFFLQLNRLFKLYADYAGKSTDALFLDTRGEIRELLKGKRLTNEVKWLLNKELALSYSPEDTISEEQTRELLSAVFVVNAYYNTGFYDEKLSRLEIEETIQKHTPAFINLLKVQESKSTFNSIVEAVLGTPVNKEWIPDPSYPNFKSTDNEYQIDLEMHTISGKIVSGLPKEIANHPDVLKVFSDNPPKEVTAIGRNGFQVSFQGNVYRLFQANKDMVVQREFEVDGKRVWGQFLKLDPFRKNEIPQTLIKSSKLWICATEPSIVLITNKNHQVIVRADNEHVHQIDPKTGKDTGLILDRTSQSSMSRALSNFEERDYYELWADSTTGLLQEIYLPRLGPSGVIFTRQFMDGKYRMASRDFPGFYIAEKPFVKELQDDFAYLLLENASGEQKVILAKQFFKEGDLSKSKMNQALESSDFLEKQTYTPHLVQQDFYQYKVDPKAGKLELPSLEARFYLSMRYLWKMRYEEAETLLRGFDSFLKPYSKEEAELLLKIANLSNLSGDYDPRATSLSLYAAYLLEKNSQDFGPLHIEKPDISRIYTTYLNQLNNIYGVRLTSEEELFLLNALPRISTFMLNRLVELDPVKAKIELDKLQPKTAIPIKEIPTVSLPSANDIIKQFEERVKPEISIIRTKFSFSEFTAFWRLTQATTQDVNKNTYKLMTELDFPEGDINWKKELASTLRMMTRTPFKESNMIAWILLGSLEHPHEFPLSNLVKLREVDKDKFRDLYANTLVPKLLELYPQINKSPNVPFTFEKIKSEEISESDKILNIPESLEFQHSIALPTLTELPRTAPIDSVVLTQPLDKDSKDSSLSNLDSLGRIFSSVGVKGPVVKREMARVASSIDQYKNTVEQKKETFALKSIKDLTNYANDLKISISKAEENLKVQEQSLRNLANKPSEDLIERAKAEALRVGQSRAELTIKDLIYLYWNRDASLFNKANPHLTVKEIHALESGIQTMLVQATHVQQLKRVFSQIELIQKDLDTEELSEMLKQLKMLAEGTHSYNIQEHPEYLVMEYYADILLRQEQLDSLDLLQIRDGKIHNRENLGTALEMIMGAGKTTVLLPLLGILNADGDTLSIGVLPGALLPSMSQMLAESLGTGYKRMVEVVSIERETPIDEAFLRRLQNIRTGKKLMLMTDSSLQSLFLNYIEFLHNYSKASEAKRTDMEPHREVFREIFTLLKERSSVLIDEVDQILNPRTEKQYTLGSAMPIATDEIELVVALYEILESDPEITKVLRFEFSPLSESTADEDKDTKKAFYDTMYKSVAKPRLVDAIIEKRLGVKSLEVTRFFDELSHPELQLVKDYLLTKSKPSTEFISKQSPALKDLMALAAEEIQNLLTITCVKLSNQEYGLGKKAAFAIPYHGSDTPALRSEFGTSYETLGYTVQILIKQGIGLDDINREIQNLRKEAMEELKENPLIKLEDTKAHQKFAGLTEKDPTLGLFDEAAIEEISAKVNGNLSLKLYFIKNFVAPQIKVYDKKISVNPQLYNYIFSVLNAFSGTQWDADAFPELLKIAPDEIIVGKTLGLLWENRHEPVQVIKPASGINVITQLISLNPQAAKADALIDTAGMIRGMPRHEVVKELLSALENRSDIQGIVHYDARNNLLVLEKDKSEPIPFANSRLKPNERFTFYDQIHTTGSNIKQKPTAIGIVSIGRNTILRDLLQSVWRFRGLDKSQSIQFVIDEDVKGIIAAAMEEIGIKPYETVQLEHLLLFTAYNQAKLQGDNNFRALKHKTWEVLQQEMFKGFLDPDLDSKQLAELFTSVESLFIQETPRSAWAQFGEPAELIDSRIVAVAQAQQVKGSGVFQSLPEERSKVLSAEIDRLVEKSIPLLPEKLAGAQSIYGREIEAETEMQKEVNTEISVEVESQLTPHKYQANTYFGYEKVTLKDAFIASGLENFADIFDEDLFGSLNFLPVPELIPSSDRGSNTPPFGVFNQFQKSICGLKLISKNEVIMVDQTDAIELINLYDLNLGIYKVFGDIPNYINSKSFKRKVVQAKFFNGVTHYTKEEIPLLREWIKEKGPERMRKLFVEHILKFKEESRAAYPNSILERQLK